jgi:hypothetical protein
MQARVLAGLTAIPPGRRGAIVIGATDRRVVAQDTLEHSIYAHVPIDINEPLLRK